MPSSARSEPLDLERGLPVSPADVAALWRARQHRVEPEELLAFLASLPPPSYDELRARRGPRGEPFRLMD